MGTHFFDRQKLIIFLSAVKNEVNNSIIQSEMFVLFFQVVYVFFALKTVFFVINISKDEYFYFFFCLHNIVNKV